MTALPRWTRVVLLLALAAAGAPARAPAQQRDDGIVDRPLATRPALEDLARRLEQGRGAVGDAGSLLSRVRARLTEGDFRSGDRIRIEVQGEPTLTDTFAVSSDRALLLPAPTVGSLPLAGVLRSEIEPQVTAWVKKFIAGPVVVRARPLLRLSVQGEVARPGIHAVPADAVLGEVLMAAGGTLNTSNMKKLRLEREGRPIWNGQDFQKALAEGRSVDAALLHDGDQIVVGRRNDRGMGESLNFLWVVVSLAGGIYGLSRAF
ncbi:MAG TPA: hypothetical protein VGQ17_05835 [Gemmatimonadales bacterium]|jgi:protein involved in polysaccharide export with SLBB domain|nr:hypothetical protein [Gemmatimonadales bacterium]